jgi:histidine triad (HIT) family protein
MNCLFCNIVEKKIPATIIYEDEDVIAFEDITPRAPSHLLIIPKQHIASLNDLDEKHIHLAGKLLHTANKLAKILGYSEQGYRVVMNCGKDAGQTVFHMHLHLLGGRVFQWPPG